jgi:hypothetical protein
MEMPNGDTLSARRADCQRGLAIAPNNLLRAKGAGGGGIIPVAAALVLRSRAGGAAADRAVRVICDATARAWQSDRRAAIRQSMSPRGIVHLDMSVINHRRPFRPQY